MSDKIVGPMCFGCFWFGSSDSCFKPGMLAYCGGNERQEIPRCSICGGVIDFRAHEVIGLCRDCKQFRDVNGLPLAHKPTREEALESANAALRAELAEANARAEKAEGLLEDMKLEAEAK